MKKIVLLIVTIGIALTLAVLIIIPDYLKEKIESSISETCPTCEFHLDNLSFDIFELAVVAHHLTFNSPPKRMTLIGVKADLVKICINFSKLLNRDINLTKVDLDGLQVRVEETYNPRRPPARPEELKRIEASYGGKWLEALPLATLDGIKISNSGLEYVLNVRGKQARILVSKISADIGSLGTRKGLGPKLIEANLKGVVQKSGGLNFKCKADLFSVHNQDQIDIEVQHLPMAELNTFFVNEDGIEMQGELDRARAVVTLSQGHLSGEMRAKYNDLSFHAMATSETSPLQAALTNFIQSLKVAKTKPAPNKPPPAAVVNYDRKPGESVVNFILQGLKEAAFKVTSN